MDLIPIAEVLVSLRYRDLAEYVLMYPWGGWRVTSCSGVLPVVAKPCAHGSGGGSDKGISLVWAMVRGTDGPKLRVRILRQEEEVHGEYACVHVSLSPLAEDRSGHPPDEPHAAVEHSSH